MSQQTDQFALRVVEQLKSHCHAGTERINAFIRWNRQVEGWFKGELLTIAAKLIDIGAVKEFRPDCRIDTNNGKQNIDLYFVTDLGEPVWIELKHWYLGRYERGANWSATTYCTQSTSGTPNNFIRKLPVDWRYPTYLLIAMTPAPKLDDWSRALCKLQHRHCDRTIRALTTCRDFPPAYYLALLEMQWNVRAVKAPVTR
jgi:hypothetical protein